MEWGGVWKKNNQKTGAEKPKRGWEERRARREHLQRRHPHKLLATFLLFFVLARLHLHRVQKNKKKNQREEKTTKKQFLTQKIRFTRNWRFFCLFFFLARCLCLVRRRKGAEQQAAPVGGRGGVWWGGQSTAGGKQTNKGKKKKSKCRVWWHRNVSTNCLPPKTQLLVQKFYNMNI